MQHFMDKLGEWSDEKWGPFRPPSAPMDKLIEEVGELIDAPYDAYEYADVFMVWLDAARMAGYDWSRLERAIWRKFEINQAAPWVEVDGHLRRVKDEHGQ